MKTNKNEREKLQWRLLHCLVIVSMAIVLPKLLEAINCDHKPFSAIP